MTTIAYRNGILAADARACAGDNIIGNVVKIARNKVGDLAGAAGLASYNFAFLEWFRNAEQGEPPKASKDDGNYDRGTIFRVDGRIEVYEPTGKHCLGMTPYYALGSGRPEALGAMFVGADAEMAVKAAAAHDINTGGPITILRHVRKPITQRQADTAVRKVARKRK